MKCKCGCGLKVSRLNARGKVRAGYVHGHNRKGKSNYWSIKETVNKRTYHARANKLVKKDKCEISNNDCNGKLEIAHLDGDYTNNNINNLACLCKAHHTILDKRNLSLNRLKSMRLDYYVDKSGKRRYKSVL